MDFASELHRHAQDKPYFLHAKKLCNMTGAHMHIEKEVRNILCVPVQEPTRITTLIDSELCRRAGMDFGAAVEAVVGYFSDLTPLGANVAGVKHLPPSEVLDRKATA